MNRTQGRISVALEVFSEQVKAVLCENLKAVDD
jgi:hypothetical protein